MFLIIVLLVIVLLVSFFIVQRGSKVVPTFTPSPAPPSVSPTSAGTTSSITSAVPSFQTSTPTLTFSPSLVPTAVIPTPTGTTSPIATVPRLPPMFTPTPTFSTVLYPGEVTEYQGSSLTPISVFVQELILHPDVAIVGWQYLNQSTYHLGITGLVNNSLEYTYDDVVNNFPSYQQVSTLLCVEGWGVTMLWEGVRVSDLLQQAGVSSNATVVIFHASDGYTSALPLDFVKQNNIMLAYKMNNITLPASAGFPLALVAQSQYGYKWVKWVTELEVSNDTGYLGFWESKGYPNNATVTIP